MTELGYHKSQPDHFIFRKRYAEGDFIILLLYVDDMPIVGNGTKRIALLEKELSKSFAMKDLGLAKQILGMKISCDRSKKLLWLSQERYIEKVLERFNMQGAKSVASPLAGHQKLSKEQCPSSKEEKEAMSKVPYQSPVGSLMYVMVCTRLDIAYAVGVVSQFITNPGEAH
jgi:ATP-binding cassette subfamily B (MDR/TAP) protein 1